MLFNSKESLLCEVKMCGRMKSRDKKCGYFRLTPSRELCIFKHLSKLQVVLVQIS